MAAAISFVKDLGLCGVYLFSAQFRLLSPNCMATTLHRTSAKALTELFLDYIVPRCREFYITRGFAYRTLVFPSLSLEFSADMLYLLLG
jgi:hypothetical protein